MAENYEKVKILGSGSFGKAWLVMAKKNSMKYVIKEIKVTGLAETERERTITEVEVLARCKHVNIIRYREAWFSQGVLCICMEYATDGDLGDQIKKQNGRLFSETVILDWFIQTCFALRYIHGHHILHRDLKTQNIFLTTNKTIKVGDFGIARVLENTEDHAVTAVGTPYYLSPEICQRKPYNHKSDMWSLGCVLYELACLTHPFDAPDLSLLMVEILHAKYKPIPGSYSALLMDLVAVLLRTNPEDRPSSEQVLCVPALQQNVNHYVNRLQKAKENSISSPATPKGRKREVDDVRSTPPSVKKTPHVGTPSSSVRRCSSPLVTNRSTPKPGHKRFEVYRDNKENISHDLTPCKQSRLSSPASRRLQQRRYSVNSSDESCAQSPMREAPKMNLHKEIVMKKADKRRDQQNCSEKEQQELMAEADKQGTYTVFKKTEPELSNTNSDINRLLYERNVMNSGTLFSSVEEVQAYLQGKLGVIPFKSAMSGISAALKAKKPFEEVSDSLDLNVLPYFPLFVQLLQLKWVANF